ncbi:MAG: menC [Naasia sp.]|nr:menC [Naasia sp.]
MPALLAAPETPAAGFAGLVRGIIGQRMAKTALLDAELRGESRSLGDRLGAVRTEVDCGVSVGIAPDLEALLDEVAGYVAEGYRRIKLKIKPGWDLEPWPPCARPCPPASRSRSTRTPPAPSSTSIGSESWTPSTSC